MEESKIKDEIWKTVHAMNRLWTDEGRPEELKNYFHKNMVAVVPTARERVEGQEACVAGWKAFSDAANIHYWKEIDPKIQLYGDGKFAVVSYYFDMSFDMGGQTIKMGGRDLFSLVHEDGRWQVVSDQFSSYP